MDLSKIENFPVEICELTTGYLHRGEETMITRYLTAELRKGELTCLLGRNGAGKSTLLRTLSGFMKPLAGSIKIMGHDISHYSAAELARLIGVVLTERMLLPDMTARDLVEMGRSPYTGFWGRLSTEDARIVDEALALVGMANFANRQLDTLSDGERQKIMIAKALAQQTPIIYLDEPTAFLDYPSKVETMRLLRDLARSQGKAVFLSTHDLELALQIADSVWLMDRDNNVEIGAPEDLALSGSLQQYFGSEGVAFDSVAGLFRIALPTENEIIVKGEGRKASLLRRALQRSGYNCIADGKENCPIAEITATGQYTLNGEAMADIATLLHALKNLTPHSAACRQ